MEVILSTAFGVKAETQTVENDAITELAKKVMAPHPIVILMCKVLILYIHVSWLQFTVCYLVIIIWNAASSGFLCIDML